MDSVSKRPQYTALSDVLSPQQIQQDKQWSLPKKVARTEAKIKLNDVQIGKVSQQHYSHLLSEYANAVKGREITIILGANGSGKTTQVVPEVLKTRPSVVMSIDKARLDVIQEHTGKPVDAHTKTYDTFGSASKVVRNVQGMAVNDGYNIVLTTTATSVERVAGLFDYIKGIGYEKVHVVLAQLDPGLNAARLYARNEQGAQDPIFGAEQPHVNPSNPLPSDEEPTTSEHVFDLLVAQHENYNITSATKYNTNVSVGQPPELVSYVDFSENSEKWRAAA